MTRLRRILIVLVVLAAAIGGGWGWSEYQRWTTRPLPLSAPQVITVAPGTPVSSLARRLKADGVLPHARDLAWLARLRGQAAAVQAGEYQVTPRMTAADLLDKLVNGRVLLHAITIVEGMTFSEMLDRVEASDAVRHTLKDDASEAVMQAIGAPEGMNAEGWFLPDTYKFPRGTTDREFLRRAYQAMQNYLNTEWAGRGDELPLDSPYDALIMASIVEKETAVPEERERIAGVFERRLKRGMRLQTDPTVIYGLGSDYDGNITRRDLHTDTPYNTYTRGGLPPTPICLPSRASIHAVLHPEKGSALYFVATGDGHHVFSDTLAEHNAAVRKYQLHRGD